jgi:hypothetical protein
VEITQAPQVGRVACEETRTGARGLSGNCTCCGVEKEPARQRLGAGMPDDVSRPANRPRALLI